MIRRHFFLAGALAFLVVLLVAGGLKLVFGGKGGPSGGPGGGAMAQGRPGGGGPGMRGGGGGQQVTLVAATQRTFADRIEVLGVAKGRQSVTITSPTTELVTRVLFRDGQYVRAGAVLVVLQTDEQDADIAQAQSRFLQAQRDWERWQSLAQKGVAPRATAEQYRASFEAARAALAAAQARRLDRVIRAPFAGRVGLTDVAPGALINPGAPIVTLDDIAVMRVDFEVPDRYLPILRVGMPIVARPDAYPDQRVPGSIAQLDSRIDERTRAITARAEFPNPGGQIMPGMLMRVGIEQAARQGVSVPESAVQFEGEQAFVFAVRRGDRGMQAQKRPVQMGASQDGFVEIRSGLRAGEQVVADGLNRIQDGQPVMLAGQGGQGGRPGQRPTGGQGTGGPPPGAGGQGAR